MSETLHTCPGCNTPNFTARGLKAHVCKGVKRDVALAVPGSDDEIKGAQLTTQYELAVGGMQNVLICGAMMMLLRAEHPEMTKRGNPGKKKGEMSARGHSPMNLSTWLEKYAPKVKRTTALRFLAVTEAIEEDYVKIVGTKVAKLYSLPELVTTPDLPREAENKKHDLFEWVNGTSQRSWLDRFQTGSPQQRGRKTRQELKPKPKSAEELAADAEAEIGIVLGLLNAWFKAGHQLRVKSALRHTTEAALEGALQKLRAVK